MGLRPFFVPLVTNDVEEGNVSRIDEYSEVASLAKRGGANEPRTHTGGGVYEAHHPDSHGSARYGGATARYGNSPEQRCPARRPTPAGGSTAPAIRRTYSPTDRGRGVRT